MLKKPEYKMMIDLHGQSVQEVKKQLAEQFALIEEKNITEFYIITGKGNHPNSDGSRGVFKKILPKLLKPYSQHISEINSETGAYKVTLKNQTERNPLKGVLNYLFGDEEINHAKFLTKRAEEDDVNALIDLALIHSTGALKDFSEPQKAIPLLERAKQLGALDAYTLLGEFYRDKSDYKNAIEHFQYAAERNDPLAQLALGECYLLGKGVKHNDEQAVYWLTKAADQGQAYAQNALGRSYYTGEFTPQNVELAVKYLTSATDQGMSGSMVFLARCYACGDGVKQDSKKAFALYLKAAEWDDVYALFQVGQYILDGRSGLLPNVQKAFPWFLKAAELGDGDSQARVANFYLFDEKKDIEKGLAWLKKAVDQKNSAGYRTMGHAYWKGMMGQKDDQKAYEFIKLSAEANYPPAQFDLAVMLFTGINKAVKQDEIEGNQWLQKAAEQGCSPAVSALQAKSGDICAILLRDSELTNDQRKFSTQPKGLDEFLKFLELNQSDKKGSNANKNQHIEYLIKAAKAGYIVAQAMVLQMPPELQAVSEGEYDSIAKSFWQQDEKEVLAIPTDAFKFVVVDAYMLDENVTKKQRKKIIRVLNALAEQQYPQALLQLANIYRTGKFNNNKKDIEKAKQYWLQGAKLNDPDCLCCLGYYYEEKAQVDASAYNEAFTYHEKAANLDSANSYNQLGLLYSSGHGVKKNIAKAVECFKEAMRLDSEAMESQQRDGLSYNSPFSCATNNLASLYWNGDEDFPSDRQQAIFWYIKAAAAGHENASKIIKQLGISTTDKVYQVVSKVNFWQDQRNSPKTEEKEPKEILNELTQSLGLEVNWKITKKDEAWCYIKPDDLTKLERYSLAPFTVQATKDEQSILLLKNVSTYDLVAVTNEIKAQMQLSQLTL